MTQDITDMAKTLTAENIELKRQVAELQQVVEMVSQQRAHWNGVASNLEIQLTMLRAKQSQQTEAKE